MSQEKRLGLRGPIFLALGGTFVVFALVAYSYLLFEGRLSWPYTGAASGMMLFVCVIVFLGLFVLGMGQQMIMKDSK